MLFYLTMNQKERFYIIRCFVLNFIIRLILVIFLSCVLLVLFILGVMVDYEIIGIKGSWIMLFVISIVWINISTIDKNILPRNFYDHYLFLVFLSIVKSYNRPSTFSVLKYGYKIQISRES